MTRRPALLAVVASEAVANASVSRTRWWLITAILSIAIAAGAVHEAVVVHQLTSASAMAVRQGSRVFVATLPEDKQQSSSTGIPGTECDAISANLGVAAVGTLQDDLETLGTSTHPAAGFTAMSASPGFLAILGQRPVPGIARYVGPDAAAELGIEDGSWFQVKGERTVRAAVIEARGPRTDVVGRSIVTVRPANQVRGACFIEFAYDLEPATATRLIAGYFPGAATQRLTANSSIGEVADRYREGSFRLWVVLVTLVCVVPWILSIASRKSELVLYSLMSQRRAVPAAVLAIEWLLSLGVAAVLGVGLVALNCGEDGIAARAGLGLVALDSCLLAFVGLFTCLWQTRGAGGEFELLRSSR